MMKKKLSLEYKIAAAIVKLVSSGVTNLPRRLINGHSGISPDMALRLSKLLPNTDMLLWMNLQRDYDIWVTKKYSTKIRIKPLKAV